MEHLYPDQKRNSLVEERLVRPALQISLQQGHEPHQHDHADLHHGHDHHPDDQKRNGLVERRLVRPTLHLSYSRLRPQHEHGPGQHEHNFQIVIIFFKATHLCRNRLREIFVWLRWIVIEWHLIKGGFSFQKYALKMLSCGCVFANIERISISRNE